MKKWERLINPKHRIGFNSTRNSFRLVENTPSAKHNCVEIIDFPVESIGIKLDAMGVICNVTNKREPDIQKGADGLFLISSPDKAIALVCDIKSDSPKDYTKQMKASSAFSDYFEAILFRLFNESLKFSHLYILFYLEKGRKNPTKGGRFSVITKDGVKVAMVPNRKVVSYNELLVAFGLNRS